MEEALLRWGPLLISLVSVVYAISSARGKAASERVSTAENKIEQKASADSVVRLAARVDAVEDRCSRLEGEMRHLPSREQTHDLALALKEMKGELGVLTEKLKPISHTTERLQEFLIEEAKSKRSVA